MVVMDMWGNWLKLVSTRYRNCYRNVTWILGTIVLVGRVHFIQKSKWRPSTPSTSDYALAGDTRHVCCSRPNWSTQIVAVDEGGSAVDLDDWRCQQSSPSPPRSSKDALPAAAAGRSRGSCGRLSVTLMAEARNDELWESDLRRLN